MLYIFYRFSLKLRMIRSIEHDVIQTHTGAWRLLDLYMHSTNTMRIKLKFTTILLKCQIIGPSVKLFLIINMR